MLTLLYFEKGQAPEGARRVELLPKSEWDLFEGETGIQLWLYKDVETGEPLPLHAALTLDRNVGSITQAEKGGPAVDLYLVPVVEPEQRPV